jgi:hypothetical protein
MIFCTITRSSAAALRLLCAFTLSLGLPVSPLAAAQETPQGIGITYGQPSVPAAEFSGDLRRLPLAQTAVAAPRIARPLLRGPVSSKTPKGFSSLAPQAQGPLAPMPNPILTFAGISFNDSCTGGPCGGGWPPDPNGDVGPNHYIEAVNTAYAIYDKSGTRLAAFTEDQLWSGAPASPCVAAPQGDPVVIYDWLADRFVLTHFAFATVNGPFYQCIAASKTSDPVAGGWWLYAVRMDPGGAGLPPVGDINDYGKFGLWHDCLYMAANAFTPSSAYDGVSFASFSRSDLYSGAPLTFSIGYLPPSSNAFTLIPGNNQGKGANAVQPGTPNYFVSESGVVEEFEVRKFSPGPNCGAGGTLGAPTIVSQAQYTFQQGAIVPQPNTSRKLDMIDDRIMQKVQYRKIGGTESLWVAHPVGTSSGTTAMQWAQLDVTGGVVATPPGPQQIYAPDTSLYRFMGSLAVDGQGNMALGYTRSNATSPNFPSIAYSGRLATDPLNTMPQTEVIMTAGSGSQVNNCGGGPCDRWGDYSAMSVDPADDCTFWYINEYYSSQANGTSGNWQTRIGSFKFPSCSSQSQSPTTTALGSAANPANAGTSVVLTATVTGTGPTGNVNFSEGGSALAGCAAVALSGGGSATCTISSLSVGSHAIVASYGGDAGNAGSTSNTLLQVINTASGATNHPHPTPRPEALATSVFSAQFPVAASNNNERKGAGWGNGGGWNDATANAFPDWVEIDFNGNKTIDRVIVYTLQDNYANPIEPTDSLTFAQYGVTAFNVQGWNGAAWVTLGSVSGNNLVKRAVTFSPFSTTRIRVNVTSALMQYSRLVEVEAWGSTAAGPPPSSTTVASSLNPSTVGASVTFTATVSGSNPTGNVAFTDGGNALGGCSAVALTGSGNVRTAACTSSALSQGTHSIVAAYAGDAGNAASSSNPLSQVVNAAGASNVALASNGAIASASSTISSAYPVAAVNNNERAGVNWGNGGGWNDATANTFPDTVQISFNGSKTINRVVVYTLQDNYANPVEPTDTMSFSLYGVTAFVVQGWTGSSWTTLATVSGNNLVKRSVTFSAFTTTRIRLRVTAALASYSRITEIEAWGN